jgi:hypothetical protein
LGRSRARHQSYFKKEQEEEGTRTSLGLREASFQMLRRTKWNLGAASGGGGAREGDDMAGMVRVLVDEERVGLLARQRSQREKERVGSEGDSPS